MRGTSPGKRLAFLAATICSAALFGGAVAAQAQPDPSPEERTGDGAVGASIVHPEKLFVERENHTYDGTYGFTLWQPAPEGEEDVEGGDPQVRVALAYELKPGQIEGRIGERIAEHPDVEMKRQTVGVGERKLKGEAVGPIPGSTPSTEVYVAEKGRVYQINVYGEELDAKGQELLSGLRLEEPSRSVASLKLKDGKKSENFWEKGGPEPPKTEREARGIAAAKAVAKTEKEGPIGESASGPTYRTVASGPTYGTIATAEYQIAEGCYRADSGTYFQTQHGSGANAYSGDGIPTGFTVVGRPNFWGQYTHGSLGYGRCASTYYTNDKFAIDYPLNRGNYVFSPFARGTVVFAGRNYSHKNYGIMVVIRDANGRYVNLSAHLNSFAAGIYKGKTVYASTVIG